MSTKVDEKLWEKYHEHLLNEQLTAARRAKLRTMYVMTSNSLRVPLTKAARQDIEQLVRDLHADKIRNRKGKPLSSMTKSDIKKFIKQFYKWYAGQNEFYPPEVAWLRTKIAKDDQPPDKETLNIGEVRRLADALKNAHHRILTLMLFDSGFRISEMLSVRKNGLEWEEFDNDQKCWWVTCRLSKTITRKVPIPLFTEDINNFVKTAEYEALPSDQPLFTIKYAQHDPQRKKRASIVEYGAYRKQLALAAKKLFNKKISPHALRHSSATYYSKAFEGNMNLIADRYGWTYNSKELSTYIRKSGAYQKPQAKRIFQNDVVQLKEENATLHKEMEEMREMMRQMKEKLYAEIHEIAQRELKERIGKK